MQRIGGARRKTRHKLKRPLRAKGKLSLRKFFQKFQEGDKVVLIGDSYYQRGMYNRRFHGAVGTVKGKQGRCYMVEIKDRKMSKLMITHPVHLRRV